MFFAPPFFSHLARRRRGGAGEPEGSRSQGEARARAPSDIGPAFVEEARRGRSDFRGKTTEGERKEGGSTVAHTSLLTAARVPPKGRGTVTADRV